jgi:hypothetical protein
MQPLFEIKKSTLESIKETYLSDKEKFPEQSNARPVRIPEAIKVVQQRIERT